MLNCQNAIIAALELLEEDRAISEQDTFGAWLRRQRKRRGWSQARLAAEAGISPAYVSLIERTAGTEEEPRLSREKVEGIALALDMPERDVLLVAGYHSSNPTTPADVELEVVRLDNGRSVTIVGWDAPREDKELVKALIRRLAQAA